MAGIQLTDEVIADVAKLPRDARIRWITQFEGLGDDKDAQVNMLNQLVTQTNQPQQPVLQTPEQRPPQMVASGPPVSTALGGRELELQQPSSKPRFTAPDTTAGEDILSILDFGAMMISGAASEVVGGLGGQTVAAGTGVANVFRKKQKDADFEGGEFVKEFREDPRVFGLPIRWNPSTPQAKRFAESIGELGEDADAILDSIAIKVTGEKPNPVTGEESGSGVPENPRAASMLKGAILTAFSVVGPKGLRAKNKPLPKGVTPRKATKAKQAIDTVADDLGIDIGRFDLKEQVINSVDNLKKEGFISSSKGDRLLEVGKRLRRIRKDKTAAINAEYEKVKGLRAGVRAKTIEEVLDDFNIQMNDKGIDYTRMPKVNKRVSEMNTWVEKLNESPPNTAMHLKWVDGIRKGINEDLKVLETELGKTISRQSREFFALNKMKKQIDNHVFSMARANEIEVGAGVSGSEVIKGWRNARAMAERVAREFEPAKELMKLTKDDVTIAEFRQGMWGSRVQAGTGTSAKTVRTTKALKNLLGEDSVEWKTLQSDFRYTLAEPFLKQTPDFRKFLNDMETFRTGANKEMLDIMMPDVPKAAIAELEAFARVGVEQFGKGPDSSMGALFKQKGITDPARAISVMLFGHQMAKASLRVNVGSLALAPLMGALRMVSKDPLMANQSRQVYMSMLGYDPTRSMIPKGMARSAVMADVIAQEMEKED